MSFDQKHTHWLMPERGLWTPPSLCSLMSPAALGIFGRIPGYAGDAAAFDGVNDNLVRASAWTGSTNRNEGILSFWWRGNSTAGDGVAQYIFQSTQAGSQSQFQKSTANVLNLTLNGTGINYNWSSTAQYTSTSGWVHFLASWNPTTGLVVYINNSTTGVGPLPAASTATTDYEAGYWTWGSQNDGTSRAYMDFFDVYFNMSTSVTLNAATRAKFISGSKPVSLSTDGSTITGTAPIMMMHMDDGESSTAFATNRGSGGNWTITGALATSTSSPTD